MDQQQIFEPVVALVFLTLLVWAFMYYKRLGFIRKQKLDPEVLKSKFEGEKALAPVAGPSDNLKNLFEMPVLRTMHSLIQSTYNRIVHRFSVYTLSMFVLIWMWLRFVVTG